MTYFSGHMHFKDQKSADSVKKQLSDLSNKIDHTLQPVFKSHKICEDLKMCEPKPLANNALCAVVICVMQSMSANGSRRLHQHIDEHRHSAICKPLR